MTTTSLRHGPPFGGVVRPAALAAALAAALLASACARPEPEPPGAARFPIVLITFEGLRADAVGALGGEGAAATPNLDRLIREADWAGRGIAASSRAAPAAASLLTGLQPWKHQVLDEAAAPLAPELRTLAEALGELGYRTSAYASGPWLVTPGGFRQGFAVFRPLRRRGLTARGQLQALRGEPELVWIHLQHPSPPWRRRDWLLGEGEPAEELPEWIHRADLEAYRPAAAPPHLRERFRALYLNNVAWADVQLGRYLEALEESGQGDEVLLLVTSTHGQWLGEASELGAGAELSRPLLEVPLILHLPRGLEGGVAAPPGARLATVRVWATLVEAAGGTVPPGVAPSLLRRGEEEILSGLYAPGPGNLFSLLAGEHQLLWRTRSGGSGPPALPLSGDAASGEPELTLLRWTEAGFERLDDPARAAHLARRLRRRWASFLDEETTAERQAAGLSLGR